MGDLKKLSLAIFETPTDCRGCPCVHITYRYTVDRCQLVNKLIDVSTSTEPIPDWCPLKPVVFNENYAE